MRRFAFAALLAAPLAVAAVAAPAAAQSAGAPFTGLHIDGLAGWDNIQNHGHSNDITYGIGAGYDVPLGEGVRLGVEGEVSDSNNKSCFGDRTAADPRFCAKAARDLYVGGRIGKVVDGGRALLYAKAGYTNARMKLTENDGDGQFTLDHTNLDGVRLGVGGEYGLTRNTFLKAEYRYSNYEQGFSRNQIVGGFGVRF
jgi:outer membrane immunogenic protein